MKYFTLILSATILSSCASSGGISFKHDQHGIWSWADGEGIYSISWHVDPTDSQLEEEQIFLDRAALLCNNEVLNTHFFGRQTSTMDYLSGGFNNLYLSNTVQKVTTGGHVSCLNNSDHVWKHEFHKWSRGETDVFPEKPES
jgi:hypothetical protein